MKEAKEGAEATRVHDMTPKNLAHRHDEENCPVKQT